MKTSTPAATAQAERCQLEGGRLFQKVANSCPLKPPLPCLARYPVRRAESNFAESYPDGTDTEAATTGVERTSGHLLKANQGEDIQNFQEPAMLQLCPGLSDTGSISTQMNLCQQPGPVDVAGWGN